MNIIDDDKRFEINVGTRDVKYAGEGKVRLIQGDHNSERITFSMDRYVEGHDMSACTKVEIHYINISSSGKEKSEGVYTVEDLTINTSSDDSIVFSWLISVNATRYTGSVNFIIKFTNLDADNNVIYSWSTGINKEIIIGEGMNCGEDFDEEYSDVLAKWEARIKTDLESGIQQLHYYGDKNIVPSPQSDFVWSVSDDTATITQYTGDDINVIIPYEYNGYPVTSIGEQTFKGNWKIKSVIIPKGVTTIGASAFQACSEAVEITVPDSVLAIGDAAFRECYHLREITIPYGITVINSTMFYHCENLKSIIIPEGVTAIRDSAFYGCKSLEYVELPNSMKSIHSYAFGGCVSLIALRVPDSVSWIDVNAFTNLTALICSSGSYAESYAKNKYHMIGYTNNFFKDLEDLNATCAELQTRITALEQQIGDINTASENTSNGGVS